MNKKHILHLYWRAGFGVLPKESMELEKQSKQFIVNDLFKKSLNAKPLSVDTSKLDTYTIESFKEDKMARQAFLNLNGEKFNEYNYAWIDRLNYSNQILRERMTLFWANHFVCRDRNIYHLTLYNNALRENALGNFRDFVKVISKEASMIKYLDTRKNSKRSPNENFSRELLELFTLGVGNYSEQDIKEGARAFTGYKYDEKDGSFIFNEKAHDGKNKTFLNKQGAFYGDDIIDIILEQEQCAKFICEKIYKYFVNDKLVDSHVSEMVAVFYPDYNIETLMRYVFTSNWFYNDENIGTKIKSPIELLVGMNKVVPMEFKEKKDYLKIQKLLGQFLLDPPNVAGWKGGKGWIDTNSLMFRLKLPQLLLANTVLDIKEKGEFTESYKTLYKKTKTKSTIDVTPDWNYFKENFETISFNQMKENLIQCALNDGTEIFLESINKYNKKDIVIQMMSLPEYQLC
ncbi:DUF1800 domain-containing protein [Oceanihabitans sp. 2_MG-2023]|uniref:DUF1800 domain-containing protein n=1 Tax=Oceanihabitans sp. 2_MG-2023 TaxID=3062661 RepID=UPI0026E19699|nr:DUF1800 domain-containing protein [Oceanihabitans sp. 2_MG-2023]MDO6595740.1 DUF1800 domain-containing protein [Oceanihabitans sp. 2_MG-2023]